MDREGRTGLTEDRLLVHLVTARLNVGVPEVLEEGALGELVESEDPEAMTAAVVRALERLVPDHEKDDVVRRLSVERLCADIAALYREELARAGVENA